MEEVLGTVVKTGSTIGLQCATAPPAGSNRSLADIRQLGRTTSRDSWDRQDDAARTVVALSRQAGELGSITFSGYTLAGAQVILTIIQWADGGTTLYQVKPFSTMIAERIDPSEIQSKRSLTNTLGDGVSRVVPCGA